MWTRFRWWVIALMAVAAPVAYFFLKDQPGPPGWQQYVALGAMVILVIGYLIGEVAWNLSAGKRACVHCGHQIEIRSFSVKDSCPNCGKML